jgi:hypothetical protein
MKYGLKLLEKEDTSLLGGQHAKEREDQIFSKSFRNTDAKIGF